MSSTAAITVGLSVETSEAEVVKTSATQIREKTTRIRWSDRSPEGVVAAVVEAAEVTVVWVIGCPVVIVNGVRRSPRGGVSAASAGAVYFERSSSAIHFDGLSSAVFIDRSSLAVYIVRSTRPRHT